LKRRLHKIFVLKRILKELSVNSFVKQSNRTDEEEGKVGNCQ